MKIFLPKNIPFILTFISYYIFYAVISLLPLYLEQNFSTRVSSYSILGIFLCSNYAFRTIGCFLFVFFEHQLTLFIVGLILTFVGLVLINSVRYELHTLLHGLTLISIGSSLLQLNSIKQVDAFYKNKYLSICKAAFFRFQIITNIATIFAAITMGLLNIVFNLKSAILGIAIFNLIAIYYSYKCAQIKSSFQIRPAKRYKILMLLMVIIFEFIVSQEFYRGTLYANATYFYLEIIFAIVFSYCIIINWKYHKLVFVNLMVLGAATILFFSIFQQINGSILIFIQHNVSRTLYTVNIPVEWYFSIESFFVLIINHKLKKFLKPFIKSINYNIPINVFLGLLFVAVAFSLLSCSYFFSQSSTNTNSLWLLPFYFFMACGELAFVPAIFTFFSKKLPEDFYYLSLAFIFLCKSMGSYFSAMIANIFIPPNQYILYSSTAYFHFFIFLTSIGLIGSMIYIFLNKILEDKVIK